MTSIILDRDSMGSQTPPHRYFWLIVTVLLSVAAWVAVWGVLWGWLRIFG